MTAAKSVSAPRVITLNFHGIGAPNRELEPGEERFWITEDDFHGILDVAIAHRRHVEFTFDDANESDYAIGLPALQQRRVQARFFVITDRIGSRGSLKATQITEMSQSGMGFGTHGASHRPWPELARNGELHGELVASSRILQDLSGRPTRHAAFPQGLYSRAVLAELRRHGFLHVYSVDEGWARSKSWLRTRYSVIESDTPDSIRSLLDSPNLTAGRWPVRPARQAVKRWR